MFFGLLGVCVLYCLIVLMGHVSHSIHIFIKCPYMAPTLWRPVVVLRWYVHMTLQPMQPKTTFGIPRLTQSYTCGERESWMEGSNMTGVGKGTHGRPHVLIPASSGNKHMGLGYTTCITSVLEYFPSRRAPFTSPNFHQAPGYCFLINSVTAKQSETPMAGEPSSVVRHEAESHKQSVDSMFFGLPGVCVLA